MKQVIVGGVFESEEEFNAYMTWIKEHKISRNDSFKQENVDAFLNQHRKN